MSQRKLVLRFVIFTILVFSLIGCSETAKFNKIATELENQGKYREAADNYYSALQAKKENENAQVGMQRTGQKALNDYVSKFNNYYDFEDYEKSYESFNEILNYRDKVQGVGVILNIEKSTSGKFQKNKEILAQMNYDEGEKKQSKSKWDLAIKSYIEVKKYIRNYKQVNAKLADCFYNKANSEFNNNNFRKAYYTYSECLNIKPDHKAAKQQKIIALNKGKVKLGIFPLVNHSSFSDLADKISSDLKKQIQDYNSPFIEIEKKDNNNISDKDLSRFTNSGLTYALVGEIIENTKSSGKLNKTKAECYRVYSEKDNEGNWQKKGRKTYWYYHTKKREVSLSFEYKLVEIATNKVLISNSFRLYNKDTVEYGTHNEKGDMILLEQFDPNAKIGTVLLDSYRGIKSINDDDYVPPLDMNYFRARKELFDFSRLIYSFPKKTAENISEKICPILDAKK